LDWTLQFNPFFRNSASESIKSPIFDEIREKKKEASAPYKITLDIDRNDAFDYKLGLSEKYNLKDYQKIIFREVELIHDLR
jgi:hypothetical protein